MKNIKDKKIIVLVLILVVFTIGYFVVASRVSYAFSDNYDTEFSYNNIIETIKASALVYGSNHTDDFTEEGLLYISVQTLIDDGYLAGYENGIVVNPSNTSETLNDRKIRLKVEDGEMTAEVYS